MTKKLFTTVAATVAVLATPVLAQSDIAQRAAAAAISQAEGMGSDEDDEDGPGILLGALAGGLIIAGVVIALGGSDDDLPASP